MKSKIVAAILAVIMILSFVLPIAVHAAEIPDNGYGNEWVYDEAQVVSTETEDHIKYLNESVFANYANKPQLAFIILNDLPYNIDDYKLDMFNEYGVGTYEENHGMLFVFAINDREYALEIGDGFIKGSILRNELETDFITEEMKNSLRTGDYDTVIYQVADILAQKMADEENLVYAEKEEAAAIAKAEQEAQRAAQEAAFMEDMEKVAWGVLIVAAISALVLFLKELWKSHLRQKEIEALWEKYSRQLALFGADADRVKETVNFELKDCDSLEDNLTSMLHRGYLKRLKATLQEMGQFAHYYLYEKELESSLTYQKFLACQLPNLDAIVREVDAKEQKKKDNLAANNKLIEEFWAENKHRVQNPKLESKIRSVLNHFLYEQRLATKTEMESSFAAHLKEFQFREEAEAFCEEYKNEIHARDFNKERFIEDLMMTNQYRQYRYMPGYNYHWMRSHMLAHQLHTRQRREKQEAEEAARRRAQKARADAQRRAQQRNNASYGTSFRGGFSSGGGFKGGW